LDTSPMGKSFLWSPARTAAADWASRPIAFRIEKLAGLRRRIVARLEDILDAVCDDAEKVGTEALLTDLLPTLEILHYNEKHGTRLLSAKRRPGSVLFPATNAQVIYEPYGTVLVVAPRNNPFQLSVVPAATALLAGNGVIIKPSEKSPKVTAILRELFADAGLLPPLLEIVEGGPETAAELVTAGPDLVFFTGSAAGGKAVYRLAAAEMIPVIMELGGNDVMVVFADADLGRAAEAAAYGAFAHDGRHCVSVKRLLVEKNIFESFTAKVAAKATGLRRGPPGNGDLFPRFNGEMAKSLQRQIDEAVERGARLLTPLREGKPVFPAMVAGVSPEAAVMREESFGPLLAAASFSNEEEGLRLANDCLFGLNASVWTGDRARAQRIAKRLESGCVCINDVLVNAGHPSLPFGGVKQSGFGRSHGPEGLLAFTRPKAVMERRLTWLGGLHWFPYSRDLSVLIADLIRLRYGAKEALPSQFRGWMELALRGAKRLRKLTADLKKDGS